MEPGNGRVPACLAGRKVQGCAHLYPHIVRDIRHPWGDLAFLIAAENPLGHFFDGQCVTEVVAPATIDVDISTSIALEPKTKLFDNPNGSGVFGTNTNFHPM